MGYRLNHSTRNALVPYAHIRATMKLYDSVHNRLAHDIIN